MKCHRAILVGLLPLCLGSYAYGQDRRPERPRVRLTNTHLDVKQPGGLGDPWRLSTLMMFNSPETATFRWRTDEPGTATGVWQVSKSNLMLCNTPAELTKVIQSGDAGAAPALNNPRMFNEFTIDFAQIAPAKPTSTPEKYYVRVLPVTSGGADVKPCASSMSMAITYVSRGSISITRVEHGGTYADVFFSTTTSMTPIVEASTHNPDSTSHFGPVFNKSDVESTGKPAIEGPLHNHRVRLLNLTPCTFHHYVITGTDKNGSDASVKEGFKTDCQIVKVTFEQIHVLDDSDDLSDGDLAFGFTVGGGEEVIFRSQIGTGERRAVFTKLFPPPPTFLETTVTPNSKSPLALNVLGVDNDESEFGGSLPVCGALAKSDDCGDFAEKATSLAIYRSGPDESFTQPFTVSVKGESLRFTVRGKFQVTYDHK